MKNIELGQYSIQNLPERRTGFERRRERKKMANSLKEEFLRSQDKKGQSTAFSFLDLEKYALPLLKEAGVEEAELDLRLLLQEAFSLDTKDYLLGKREAVFTLYRKRAEEKPALRQQKKKALNLR